MKLFSKTKLAVTAAVVLVAGTVIASPFVFADSSNEGRVTITVSPSDQKISLQPGKKARSTIKIDNNHDAVADLDFSISVESYSHSQTDSNGITDYKSVDYDTKNPNNAIVDWIKLDETTGVIAPNESKTIGFTIDVPEDAAGGGQYAAIVVQQNRNNNDKDQGLTMEMIRRVAMPIYATVAGDIKMAGSIKSNDIPSFSFNPHITASTTVENTGNTHDDAKIVMRIFPLFSGEELYTNEEDPVTKTVMPNTTRFISTKYGDGERENLPFPGIYTVEQEVTFLDETSKTSKVVFVCPMWLLLVIVFIIVFIVVWLVMRNKNRKAAAQKSKKSTGTTSSAATTKPADKPEKSESPTHSEKSE